MNPPHPAPEAAFSIVDYHLSAKIHPTARERNRLLRFPYSKIILQGKGDQRIKAAHLGKWHRAAGPCDPHKSKILP